ncbi:GntR family transcriptional regulator [Cryobacterium sp. PH31-O1]|uniref:FadR/GntR family transcriptional regulator n=1 Tax=Cryobacterium sp. PH31-O1 TaxID=3046306 RepID=UPI0024BB1AB5|nr:GntR family transcriptional regulator [Cryobacterium sp. PH31-O1]MDJ0338580.1 GntR family transcriptional regulator [Cryobacterium sp. PH31-O1]
MDVHKRPGAREAIFAQLNDTGRAEQVAQRLTDAIILGVLSPRERLPSEPQLARHFGVALITVREGLVILRDTGLIETRRGREGGSFVSAVNTPHQALLENRLHKLAQVELSDIAVYFSVIVEGCATRAARYTSPVDAERLAEWLHQANFTTTASARSNAGGFFLELAVLTQSARLVREQIRVQAEFGSLLFLGLADAALRERVAGGFRAVVPALSAGDDALARGLVGDQVEALGQWLLSAKIRVERGGNLDGEALDNG